MQCLPHKQAIPRHDPLARLSTPTFDSSYFRTPSWNAGSSGRGGVLAGRGRGAGLGPDDDPLVALSLDHLTFTCALAGYFGLGCHVELGDGRCLGTRLDDLLCDLRAQSAA